MLDCVFKIIQNIKYYMIYLFHLIQDSELVRNRIKLNVGTMSLKSKEPTEIMVGKHTSVTYHRKISS